MQAATLSSIPLLLDLASSLDRTTVDGTTIHAPNADFADDTKGALLSRTCSRILARGFGVEGIYYKGENPNPAGWVRATVVEQERGLRRTRTHLIDVEQDGKVIGTVRVVEALRVTNTRYLGRNEHGREVWREETDLTARVEADRALLAVLRG